MARLGVQERRLISAFGPDWSHRAHAALRLLSFPIDSVVAELPARGTAVEVGCGHGLIALLAVLQRPDLSFIATDIDERKIEMGRRAASVLGVEDRVEFRASDLSVPGSGATDSVHADAIVCADVLYLLGREVATAAIRRMAERTPPGGVVIIKEMGDNPRAKVLWNTLQETVAVDLLGITDGRCVDPLPPAMITSTLVSCGLDVTERPLDRRSVHPHRLFVGRFASGSP